MFDRHAGEGASEQHINRSFDRHGVKPVLAAIDLNDKIISAATERCHRRPLDHVTS